MPALTATRQQTGDLLFNLSDELVALILSKTRFSIRSARDVVYELTLCLSAVVPGSDLRSSLANVAFLRLLNTSALQEEASFGLQTLAAPCFGHGWTRMGKVRY